ncbi:MAG: sigma-54-dependent Fis family transcriptional regulator [Planctomycetes bacterium]|nr:sigma-54-dependent Fis family transcriptional regulator [Planctomycetota bacterium]
MANETHVLVVEDDQASCALLEEVLLKEGYRVATARSGDAAVELARTERFGVVVSDIRMMETGSLSGIDVLKAFRAASPDTVVILITAFGSIETALEARKEGAFDYVSKPFKLEEIKVAVRRAIEHRRLVRQQGSRAPQPPSTAGPSQIVGRSRAMVDVYKTVAEASATSTTILIRGETGTGKERIAEFIHTHSPRADGPYLAINCSSLTESLLESELFGHVKGAFTGAFASKKGLFEEASGGTLFLDEVGDTPLSLQAKLLRALAEHEIKPVGSSEVITVDVRIIAATNKGLEAMVKSGEFREDLFYRLNVVPILLPPLRDRVEDIPELVQHFLEKYNAANGKNVASVAPEALALLVAYPWPGNVRQLEAVIERAVTLNRKTVILTEDLDPKLRESGRLRRLPTLEDKEKEYIQQVLQETRGNVKAAAEILGIDRKTLYRKCSRYEINIEEERAERE